MTGLTYPSFSKKEKWFLISGKKKKKKRWQTEPPDSFLPFQYGVHEAQATGTCSIQLIWNGNMNLPTDCFTVNKRKFLFSVLWLWPSELVVRRFWKHSRISVTINKCLLHCCTCLKLLCGSHILWITLAGMKFFELEKKILSFSEVFPTAGTLSSCCCGSHNIQCSNLASYHI